MILDDRQSIVKDLDQTIEVDLDISKVDEPVIDIDEEEKRFDAFDEPDEITKEIEKDSKYEALESKLNREQERYNALCSSMETFKEDYEIIKAKFTKLEADKEAVDLQKNTLTFKLQGYLDQVQEKDDIIMHQEHKIQTKDKEIDEFKKSNIKLNSQLKALEEKEYSDLKTQPATEATSESSIKLQHKILNLEKKMKFNEEVIRKIKKLPGLSPEMLEIIEVGDKEVVDFDNNELQKQESRIKHALLNREDFSDIEISSDSLYLSESEVEQLVSNQKMIHQRIEEELENKRKMRTEIQDLKEKLNETLEKVNPDIQEITTCLVEERVEEMKRTFDDERERLMLDLSNRVQKVCDLELELDMMRDEYKRLEKSLTGEDQTLKVQCQQLQRQLDQMNIMYHSAIQDNSVIKVDVQLYEKKLKTRESRIVTLEKSFRTLTEQNNKMKAYLKRIRENIEEVSLKKLESNNLTNIPSNGRVVKKIKAGGTLPQPTNYRNRIVEKVIGNPFEKR